MIYKVLKTIAPQTEGEDNNVLALEIDDLIPFDGQTDEFKGLFNSISVDNIADFDNATVILFPESNRVIISKK